MSTIIEGYCPVCRRTGRCEHIQEVTTFQDVVEADEARKERTAARVAELEVENERLQWMESAKVQRFLTERDEARAENERLKADQKRLLNIEVVSGSTLHRIAECCTEQMQRRRLRADGHDVSSGLGGTKAPRASCAPCFSPAKSTRRSPSTRSSSATAPSW